MVVEIPGLIEQKQISEPDREDPSGPSVAESEHHARCRDRHQQKMDHHTGLGPRLDPVHTEIRKRDSRFDESIVDRIGAELLRDAPQDQRAKRDAEIDQKRIVYRSERSSRKILVTRLHRRKS